MKMMIEEYGMSLLSLIILIVMIALSIGAGHKMDNTIEEKEAPDLAEIVQLVSELNE